jgi:predicted transcriptional regulator
MPVVERAIVSSKQQMIDSIFNTVLDPLSAKDMEFLRAMARDNGASEVSAIAQRMKVSQPYAQRYRRRLIEAGVIAASGRGKLDFVIPYLGEYLRGEF